MSAVYEVERKLYYEEDTVTGYVLEMEWDDDGNAVAWQSSLESRVAGGIDGWCEDHDSLEEAIANAIQMIEDFADADDEIEDMRGDDDALRAAYNDQFDA